MSIFIPSMMGVSYAGSSLPQIGLDAIARNGFHTTGLSGFWHAGNFDGLGKPLTNSPFPNTWTDLTNNGYNGTFYQFDGTTSSGAVGANTSGDESYLKSDGNNDYVTLANTNLLNSRTFTVQMRFSKVYTANDTRILAKGDYGQSHGAYIDIKNTSTIRVGAIGSWTFYGVEIPLADNEVADITLKVNVNHVNVYKNGVHAGSNSMWGSIPNGGGSIRIARSLWGDKHSNCKINYLAYYNNVEISDTNMVKNYNAGLIWSKT
jgi:hypothetical protein